MHSRIPELFRRLDFVACGTTVHTMACAIELTFSEARPRKLERIAFKAGKTRQLFRGIERSGQTGFFQTTRAVRAMVALLIQARLSRSLLTEDHLSEPLHGELGSQAASLNFALGRRPGWVGALFGSTREDLQLLYSIFHRSNPDGKRSGAFSVCVNFSVLRPKNIRIFTAAGRELAGEGLLELLSEYRETAVFARAPHRTPSLESAQRNEIDLHAICVQEAYRALCCTNIFSLDRLVGSLKQVFEHSIAKTYHWSPRVIGDALDFKLTEAQRLGLVPPEPDSKLAKAVEGMRIAISTGGVAAVALLDFLRVFRGYPIHVEYRFPNSQAALQMMSDESFAALADGINMSIPCALRSLESKGPYRPLVFMPPNSHGVVRTRTSGTPPSIVGLADSLGSSSFFISDLERRGEVLIPPSCRVGDASEIAMLLRDGGQNLASVLWWPHYVFHANLNPAVEVTTLPQVWSYEATCLMLHKACFENGVGVRLNAELRNAWQVLLENTKLLRQLVTARLNEPDFRKYFIRSCGIQEFMVRNQIESRTGLREAV